MIRVNQIVDEDGLYYTSQGIVATVTTHSKCYTEHRCADKEGQGGHQGIG